MTFSIFLEIKVVFAITLMGAITTLKYTITILTSLFCFFVARLVSMSRKFANGKSYIALIVNTASYEYFNLLSVNGNTFHTVCSIQSN